MGFTTNSGLNEWQPRRLTFCRRSYQVSEVRRIGRKESGCGLCGMRRRMQKPNRGKYQEELKAIAEVTEVTAQVETL